MQVSQIYTKLNVTLHERYIYIYILLSLPVSILNVLCQHFMIRQVESDSEDAYSVLEPLDVKLYCLTSNTV